MAKMSKGLMIGLAIAVPVVVLGGVGAIVYYSGKKRDKALADAISQYAKDNGDGTVTYTDKDGNVVTKPKSKVSVNDIIATTGKAVDLATKIGEATKDWDFSNWFKKKDDSKSALNTATSPTNQGTATA